MPLDSRIGVLRPSNWICTRYWHTYRRPVTWSLSRLIQQLYRIWPSSLTRSYRLLVKLALVLPTQERAVEAGALARQAWAEAGGAADRLAAAATLAWLLWRAGQAEAATWIERGRSLAAGEKGNWSRGIATNWSAITKIAPIFPTCFYP